MAIDQDFLKSIGLDDESIAEKLIARSSEDETGLINKRDELLGKITTQKDLLKQFEGVDVDKYSKMSKRLAEMDEKNLMDKGEFDAILQKREEEWSAKDSAWEDKYNSLRSVHLEEIEDKAILTAVGDKGDGEMILDIVKRRGWIKSVDGDNGIVLNIKSMDGEKDLETVNDLIEEMSKSEKYARLFNSSGLSGGDARHSHKGGGKGNDNVTGAARMAAARANT